MRKFAAVVALAVIGAAFAGAQEKSIHELGLAVPLWNQSLTVFMNDEDCDLKTSAVGVNLMYRHLKVSESHFSSFTNVELGYVSLSFNDDDMGDEAPKLDGFNTRFRFGLGGAPLVNDLVTLAVHGSFGVNLLYAGTDRTETVGGVKFEESYSVFDVWTTVGLNVEAAFCFTEHFGVFAGLNLYTNLFGFGVFSQYVSAGSSVSYDDVDFFLVNPGQFNVDFRVGVAFTY